MRALGASGALACGIAVGLGAYAAHVADGQAQHRIALAALFLFGHGLALLVLAPRARSRMQQVALMGLLLGVLLFSGSLALAALFGTSTLFAPFGGSLLIIGWLVYAVALLREKGSE
jgi:uncharacterized membrane protein YgdD (TMEM256/DUF423 family)